MSGKQKQPQVNLQDKVLQEARAKRMQVTVFFVNGFQMKGIIKAFDNYTFYLVNEGKEYLLYKHAVTTLVPLKQLTGEQIKNRMKPMNLQDTVLNAVRGQDMQVKVFLTNGFQIQGKVKEFDNFTILLEKEGKDHLIYKQALTTIQPKDSLSSVI